MNQNITNQPSTFITAGDSQKLKTPPKVDYTSIINELMEESENYPDPIEQIVQSSQSNNNKLTYSPAKSPKRRKNNKKSKYLQYNS